MGRRGSTASIVMVSPRYAPAIGGVERHIQRVAEELATRGHRVTILTESHARGLPGREDTGGISVRRIPYVWARTWPLKLLWILTTIRSLGDADVVHFHDVTTLLWGLPLVITRLKRGTFITYHGYEKDPVPATWRILRRLGSRLVERELCIGRFIKSTYGVHCDQVSVGATDPRRSASVAAGGTVFVGRLEKDTGVLEYIRALGIVKREHGLQVPLTLCGVGRLEQSIRETASTEKVDVKLVGSARDPLASMAKSRVCFAAGYLSMLEAMSLGLPVIGVAASPLRLAYLESMRNAGAPISIQRSPEGIAREIVRAFSDSALYASLSRRGQAFAAEMTWKRMADLYIELWSKSPVLGRDSHLRS